jgi:hypothetical protein
MEDLIQKIRLFNWTDEDGDRLPDELIVAALRNASFDWEQAAEAIFLATNQDPSFSIFASTPGQENLVLQFTRSEQGSGARNDPDNMEMLIEALRSLELKDEEGREFCPEVIAAVLRFAFYRIYEAAEMLLCVTGQFAPQFVHTLTEQEMKIEKLRHSFPGLDSSMLLEAYANANGNSYHASKVLRNLAHHFDPLMPKKL